MLNYVKLPRSVTEYTLMKGVTDFSNLKQFDVFESGYSFLTVVSTPKFMNILATKDPKVKNLQDGLVHIMEGEFRGLSGIPDITADAGELNNGVNQMQLINNVTKDTSVGVEMTFWERSGGLITNYLNTYLTGIKDPYSKAKTYHGLIANGTIPMPGPEYEVFTFLYYVTDNTMRRVEKAYLLCNAQPTLVPESQMYNAQRGDIQFQEISMTFNCFPISGDKVNLYASTMLANDLSANAGNRRIILDSNDYEWSVYKDKVENNGEVSTILTGISDGSNTVAENVKTSYGIYTNGLITDETAYNNEGERT